MFGVESSEDELEAVVGGIGFIGTRCESVHLVVGVGLHVHTEVVVEDFVPGVTWSDLCQGTVVVLERSVAEEVFLPDVNPRNIFELVFDAVFIGDGFLFVLVPVEDNLGFFTVFLGDAAVPLHNGLKGFSRQFWGRVFGDEAAGCQRRIGWPEAVSRGFVLQREAVVRGDHVEGTVAGLDAGTELTLMDGVVLGGRCRDQLIGRLEGFCEEGSEIEGFVHFDGFGRAVVGCVRKVGHSVYSFKFLVNVLTRG